MSYQPQHFKPGEAPATKPGGIITVYGHTSVGKTQFCINTWDVADTLFFANFDRCASHLIKKYEGQGGVYYDQFTAMTQPQAKGVLEKLEGMRNAAISTGKAVFVIDNVHNCANIVASALKSNKPGALAYVDINTWWNDFLLPLEKAGIWGLLTAPSRELWAETKSLGLYGADTWKHLDNPIMAEVWLFTTRPLGARNAPESVGVAGELELPKDYPALEYKAQIMLAKKRPAVQGMILKTPSLVKILRAMKEVT